MKIVDLYTYFMGFRISFIRHVKRPMHEKVVLSALMACGLVATIISVIKVYFLKAATDNLGSQKSYRLGTIMAITM
jgi:hypothetical protein